MSCLKRVAGAVVVGGRAVRRVVMVVVACAGFLVPAGAAGVARAAASPPSPVQVGKAWQHPADAQPTGPFAHFGPGTGQGTGTAVESAALRQAKAAGHAVVVGSLTSPTSMVTAEPDGRLESSSSVLPVRVRTRTGWVPVDTRLRLAGGRLVPAVVPGDSVSFSAGGTSPAAVVSDGTSSVSLSWPGSLPAPVVSGSSATYEGVLPGVNLVLTATSEQAGGFREVLEVTSRAAARDPGLSSLAWRVSAPGTSGLRALKDGGLAAVMSDGRGWFGAAAPVMWDSSKVAASASKSVVRTAVAAARLAGAGLASVGAGPASTVAGPAGGARMAGVAARVTRGGQLLSLVPDAALLSSPGTRFPVYIDPGFTYYDKTGSEQAFDPVQSECPGSNYDSSINGFSPVGYDNWGGSCAVNDTDYSLYQVGIPSGALASQAVILSASFQITEVYTSDCSSNVTMTATWINSIGKTTGWPGPGAAAGDADATTTLGPDAGSCNTVEDTSDTVAKGFNVAPDLNQFGSTATNVTFRVWENGNTDEDDHKQLTTNPTLEVIWTDTPDAPVNMEEAANSSGSSGALGCSTSASSAPRIGKTDATSGVYLDATYGDNYGTSVNGNIEYKVSTASSWTEEKSAVTNVTAKEAGWLLPSSVTSGLANGTVMEWQAQDVTGTGTISGTTYGPYSSSWAGPCYFAVYPTSPNAPTLSPNFTATTGQTVGSKISFTITQSSGDTASEFVFGIDAMPQVGGTIPATRLCSTSAAETYCSKITGGSATLTIGVPSPGPHNVWVYEIDAGGNDSGSTNGAPGNGQTTTYEGAEDSPVSYVGSGDSLQQNFDTAMDDASHSFGNTMISKEANLSDGASADGSNDSIDENELQGTGGAGWDHGATVTVDGATFTLPGFGSSTSGPDNLMAARQTLGADNAQGSALVFLATSTHANVQITGGVGTGAADTDAELQGDVTAPVTPAGAEVTAEDCGASAALDGSSACTPATGSVTYASGCSVSSTTYTLVVPDWVTGPSDIAALELPQLDTGSGTEAANVKIYAFAVPLDPACEVSTVTLPDVGTVLSQPALHIFGMSFRNTTTATPEVGGTMTASPTQHAWTGAFASSVEDAYQPPAGDTWGNQTVRIAVSTGVSAPEGADVRIRLSNPGYWSEDGSGALTIGAATIAPQSATGAPTASATPQPLTFDHGSSTSVTLPEGGDVYSDPVALPFAVSPGQGILVSLYLENSSIPYLPLNNDPSGAESWFAPSSPTANETGSEAGTPFTSGYATNTVPLLTGLDVTTSEVQGSPILPGEPTVVVTGDGGIIDGPYNSSDLPSDAGNDPSQRLAGQLVSNNDATGFGVVDTSVEDNAVLENAASTGAPGGLALEYRLDHDVLAEPDPGTVIINVGLQDVLDDDGALADVAEIEDALSDVATQLSAFGIGEVVIGSLTPCGGYSNSTAGDACDASTETGRQQVNDDLSLLGGPICEADFNAAVAQPGSSDPVTLATGDGVSDDVNLTLGTSSGGYYALAAMESANCSPADPSAVLPPSP